MPGGVNFNPDSTGVNSGSGTKSGEMRYNDASIIASRQGFEGPEGDQFTATSNNQSPGFRSRFLGFFQGLLGADSSKIEFLKSPTQQDDGSYILSKPFTADSLEAASESAEKLYTMQKGAVQRDTGEIFLGVGAMQTADGKYVAIAEGTL